MRVLPILCFLSLFFSCYPLHGKVQDFVLKIGPVYGRRSQSALIKEGMLSLQIQNNKNVDAKILFANVGFDTREKQRLRFKGEEYFDGDVTDLNYEWSNSDGTSVVKGKFQLTGEYFIKRKSTGEYLRVPIKVPSKGGSYTLKINLSNTHLKHFSQTFAGFDILETFVDLSAEKKVSFEYQLK